MEEILAEECRIPFWFHDLLLTWKQTYWKGWKLLPQKDKLLALRALILDCFDERVEVLLGSVYQAKLSDTEPFIELDVAHPSLISTLHEIGHQLYGPSELLACRFSVQIFRDHFPKSFQKLKAVGHQLVLTS